MRTRKNGDPVDPREGRKVEMLQRVEILRKRVMIVAGVALVGIVWGPGLATTKYFCSGDIINVHDREAREEDNCP